MRLPLHLYAEERCREEGNFAMKNQQANTNPVQADVLRKSTKKITVTGKDDSRPVEVGGPRGPEPTRYGDWEKAGRCSDF